MQLNGNLFDDLREKHAEHVRVHVENGKKLIRDTERLLTETECLLRKNRRWFWISTAVLVVYTPIWIVAATRFHEIPSALKIPCFFAYVFVMALTIENMLSFRSGARSLKITKNKLVKELEEVKADVEKWEKRMLDRLDNLEEG